MKQLPTARQQAYDLYWYFAAERQRIFEHRYNGQKGPWTDDVILQQYKFCNVFRAADKVSQFLIREVIYNGSVKPEDLMMQIVLFRLFSRSDTWQAVCECLQRRPIIADLANGSLQTALEYAKYKNTTLYTQAFILCANNAYNRPTKYQNHVALLHDMFGRHQLAGRLLIMPSFEAVYDALLEYPLIGPFMAYQIAIDLNYSACINFSENDFTAAGPGAMRGIAKVFQTVGDYSADEIIRLMVDRQHSEFERLGLNFNGLFGRPLQAVDCQGLFCEVDKYLRVAMPELASARQRIKQAYRQSSSTLSLFFPPKWEIVLPVGR